MFGRRKSFKTSRLKKRRRKILLIKMAAVLAVFLILVGFTAWLSSLPQMLIEEIKIEGNIVVTNQEILDVVEQNISGKYLWVFHKDNFLIYPKNKIEEDLSERFKRISSVNIYFDDFKSILVSLNERKPAYAWCQNSIIEPEDSAEPVGPKETETKTSKECYFADETGYIFSRAPQFSGTAFFEFYTKPYSEEVEVLNNVIGQYVLKPQLFGRIILFKNIVDDFGLKNTSLFEKEDSDYEISLDQGGKIIFNIKDDLEKSLNNLKVALETDSVNGGMKNDGASLQYIDLRFGNKVFYKFEN